MSQSHVQDTEELLRQTISRVQRLTPVLRWPRVAYQAKLNFYGTFYASFYDTASNRRLDNSEAGPSSAQPGSVSPATGEGSPTPGQQSQQQPQQHSEQPSTASPTSTERPSPQQLQKKAAGNGDASERLRSGGPIEALLVQTQQQTQQSQQQPRKGPRGFNIQRPTVRARAAAVHPAGPTTHGAVGGPSPDSSQSAHSPDMKHHPHQCLQQGRIVGQAKKQPPEPRTERQGLPAVRAPGPEVQGTKRTSSPELATLGDFCGTAQAGGAAVTGRTALERCPAVKVNTIKPGTRGALIDDCAGCSGDDDPQWVRTHISQGQPWHEAEEPATAGCSGSHHERDDAMDGPATGDPGVAATTATSLKLELSLNLAEAGELLPDAFGSLVGAVKDAHPQPGCSVARLCPGGSPRPEKATADTNPTSNSTDLQVCASDCEPSGPTTCNQSMYISMRALAQTAPCMDVIDDGRDVRELPAPACVSGLGTGATLSGIVHMDSAACGIFESAAVMGAKPHVEMERGYDEELRTSDPRFTAGWVSRPGPACDDEDIDTMLMQALDGWGGDGRGGMGTTGSAAVAVPLAGVEAGAAAAGEAVAGLSHGLLRPDPYLGSSDAGGGRNILTIPEADSGAESPPYVAVCVMGSAPKPTPVGAAGAKSPAAETREDLHPLRLDSPDDGTRTSEVGLKSLSKVDAADIRTGDMVGPSTATCTSADVKDMSTWRLPFGNVASTEATRGEEPAVTVDVATIEIVETAGLAGNPNAMPMPPPPSQPPSQRFDGIEPPVASSVKTPAGVSVSRRTSNISLQTLESGELPSADTPVGGTPSSALQPLPFQVVMTSTNSACLGVASGLPRAGRSSSLGPLQMLGRAGSGGVGSGASSRLGMGHLESGGLRVSLSEVIPPRVAEAPGNPEERREEGADGRMDAEPNVGPDVTGKRSPVLEPQPSNCQDGGRRRRWGAPVNAMMAAAGASCDAVGGRVMDVAGDGGGADTAQLGKVSQVDLSRAKGLVAHLSVHGSLQDVVPHIQAMSAAGEAFNGNMSGRMGLKRSRSPDGWAEHRLEREHDRGKERELRTSRERLDLQAATEGSAEANAGAGARRGASAAARSRSRSRSRERRRHSRSPRWRGSRSRSRSRSPGRDWRDKRNRTRAGDFDRHRDRDRYGGRERERERERDRARDRDLDKRGGERNDNRYENRHGRSQDYGRSSDRVTRDGRSDGRSERGASGGPTAIGGRQAVEVQSVSQQQQQQPCQQNPQQIMQQQQLQRRIGAATGTADLRAVMANGGAGIRRTAAEVPPRSESAGSVYPNKRPHRETGLGARNPGSTSRGGSGSDMDLDDSDTEGAGARNRPGVDATGTGVMGTGISATAVLPPPPTKQLPATSTSLGATAPRRPGGGIGFGQRHRSKAAAAAAAAAAATATAVTHVGSSAHSPSSTGGLSPVRTGAIGAAASPVPALGGSQQNQATSPGRPRSGTAAAGAAVAPAPGSVRQLGGGKRTPGSQALPSVQQPQNQQSLQPQQQGAIAYEGKVQRALAKLHQDRGRPQQGSAGGSGTPLASDAVPKPRPGKDGAGGPAASSGLGTSVLSDAGAVLDPIGTARVGGDVPLSSNMEPDLLGFMALSMIQFSCTYMVESPRLLFNKAHIKTLAEESRTLRRKADSNREASGNKWSTLQLTLYLQSALKSMESAFGHEQAGQEREAGLRAALELLSTASQMLAVVSHEANRLAQQLLRPPPSVLSATAAAGGDGGTSAARGSGMEGGGVQPHGRATAGALPSTPPRPFKTAPSSPTHSARSLGMHTPSGLGTGAAAGGSRTPQHGGGTPLGPLAAAVACASVGGPAPSAELLVLEAIRLLALKLLAICRTRWLLVNQDSLAHAIKLHESSSADGVGSSAPGSGGGGGGGGGDDGPAGTGGRRTSPTAAADSASSTLEAAALTASTYTASIQQMAEGVQNIAAAADAWRRAANEGRAFNHAVSAPGVDPAAVVAAARIGALGYEGGAWDLMGSVNLARKALDSITGML
ncbi:hypothetical protein VaNZ11_006623 [Volvox africanus]|uniref:Uncharacterized protein n=1 Tax=Volvox africanus TaxID=51714 RepID=A0ABQ5S148_9CHLO|nr:hypothetical protein VaNZ11_006623 [Volvox africanus]